ncbi:MAG: hypothetical protein AAB681_01070 [Patescibacteria group bacterium]|mgnify:CR=1 FL=1
MRKILVLAILFALVFTACESKSGRRVKKTQTELPKVKPDSVATYDPYHPDFTTDTTTEFGLSELKTTPGAGGSPSDCPDGTATAEFVLSFRLAHTFNLDNSNSSGSVTVSGDDCSNKKAGPVKENYALLQKCKGKDLIVTYKKDPKDNSYSIYLVAIKEKWITGEKDGPSKVIPEVVVWTN